MAEPNDEIPKINPSEVETLIEKIGQITLSEQDKRKITRLLRTLLYMAESSLARLSSWTVCPILRLGKHPQTLPRRPCTRRAGSDDLICRIITSAFSLRFSLRHQA